jgi:hypothetical protein
MVLDDDRPHAETGARTPHGDEEGETGKILLPRGPALPLIKALYKFLELGKFRTHFIRGF